MARNEAEFRDQIADILRQQGFQVSLEYRIPEGRIDILATKGDVRHGIEVKINQRGIADDIVKCWKLLKAPEVDELYVAAPDALLSSEHKIHAESLGVGIIAVTGTKLEWRIRSIQLEPANFGGGGSGYNHEEVRPGNIFSIYNHVTNRGFKIARDLEMYFTPAGPFVKASKENTRFKRPFLNPGEDWKETFMIKVKRDAKLGIYPLHFCTTSAYIKPSSWKIDLTIK
jgi:Holliday junction resolvase-like predicted endonuclease